MKSVFLVFMLCLGLALPARAGGPIGLNLAPVTDWSTQAPFLDLMKTARPWIVHRAGQWGGAGEADLIAADLLDASGWPIREPREIGTVGTVILTDLPQEATALAGTYVLRFDGKGIVEVSGRAGNPRYGNNEVTFDYTPGPGPVEIRIQRSDPQDHVRNITVVKAEYRALFETGAIFNPDWLAELRGFGMLRFMDWMATNNSRVSAWSDRPLPGDYTYARNGVPIEVMLRLLTDLGVDGWFTLPHRADDDYMRRLAGMANTLPENVTVYAEYSNEVWNWQFDQAAWANDAAVARWGQAETGPQFYGMRAARMAAIWRDVFGDDAEGPRLKTVISSQTGWLGLEEIILEAPLWQAEADGPGNPPWVYFDAYAVTGYFGGILGVEERAPLTRDWISRSLAEAEAKAGTLGLTGSARDSFVAAHRFDLASEIAARELSDGSVSGDPLDTVADLLTRVLPYHKAVAEERGLDLIIYEGGSHVVGIGPMVEDAGLTAFFTHFNYTPEMAALYARLLAGWSALGGGVFGAYNDVYAPGKWGSWGAQRWLGDHNPRWMALRGAL